MKFHEKLQVLRKEQGLSQERLAERLSVSRQAVAKWEAGQSYPDVDRLLELSDLFQTSVDQLLRNREEDACAYQNTGALAEADAVVIDFLCRAKQHTFAGYGKNCASCRPSSHDLKYEEGDLLYYDTYLGGQRFAGGGGAVPRWRGVLEHELRRKNSFRAIQGKLFKRCAHARTQRVPLPGAACISGRAVYLPLRHQRGVHMV